MKDTNAKNSSPVEQMVEIASINIPENWREIDPVAVDRLKESLASVGQLNAVILNDEQTLLAGMHRILASKELGLTRIRAVFFEGSKLEQELITLDENLVRTELCPFDRCLASARSKEIYEALHPETKQGGKKPQDMAAEVESFGKLAGKLRGVSDRTIRREVAIGKALAHIPREALQRESIAALEQLTHYDREEQEKIIGYMEKSEFSLKEACSVHEFYQDRDTQVRDRRKTDVSERKNEPLEDRSSKQAKNAARPLREMTERSPQGDFTSLTSPWPNRSEGADGVRDRPRSPLTAPVLLKRVEDVVQSLEAMVTLLSVEEPDAAATLLNELLSYFRNEINRRYGQPVQGDAESESTVDAEVGQVAEVAKEEGGQRKKAYTQ